MTLTIDTSIRSPNHHIRRAPISMLVLHATAGSAASALSWLCNDRIPLAQRVSCHYVIDKTGRVYQLVPEQLAAWQAGRSAWSGVPQIRGSLNDASIGIELVNANDGTDPYPAAQIAAAVALCRSIVARHGIVRANLVRHLDIAPGRKSDPRGLGWPVFVAAVYAPAAGVAREVGGARG